MFFFKCMNKQYHQPKMFWPLCSNFEPYFELFHYLCIFRAEGLLLLSLSLCCSSPALFSPSLSVLSLSLGSLLSSSLFHLFLLPLSTFCILSLIPISVSLLLSLPNLPQALKPLPCPLQPRPRVFCVGYVVFAGWIFICHCGWSRRPPARHWAHRGKLFL